IVTGLGLVGLVAISADRAIDDVWPPFTEPSFRKAQRFHGPGSKVLNNDIAGWNEPLQNLLSLRVLQIEGHRTLVAIQGKKIGAQSLDKRRAPAAGVVAPLGSFDLDDVGTHVPQLHGCEWA